MLKQLKDWTFTELGLNYSQMAEITASSWERVELQRHITQTLEMQHNCVEVQEQRKEG